MEYVIYPGLDNQYDFPVEVRQALADSPELVAKIEDVAAGIVVPSSGPTTVTVSEISDASDLGKEVLEGADGASILTLLGVNLAQILEACNKDIYWTGSAWPSRPSTSIVPAGHATYRSKTDPNATQPTDMTDGDDWIQAPAP